MNLMIEKVAALLPVLEARGGIYLFAFAETDGLRRWDVVLSSEWSDRNPNEAVRYVVGLLQPILTVEEITLISRVAVIRSSDPNMQALPTELNGVSPGQRKIVYASFLGSDIRQAYVFRGQRPPKVQQEALLADTLG